MKLTVFGAGLLGLAAMAVLPTLAPLQAQEKPAAQEPARQAPTTTVRANLNITPKRLVLNRDRRIASVFVFNQGNVPVTADVTVVDRVMLPDGQIKPLTDVEALPDLKPIAERLHSARGFIMVTPRRITLMPGRGQTVRLRALLPADANALEYRSHLTVVTVPPRSAGLTAQDAAAQKSGELSLSINAVFGLSIPVILRSAEPDIRADIRDVHMSQQTLSPDGTTPQQAPPTLSFDIARLGANSLYGTIQVQSTSGRKDMLGIARGVGIYPEVDARTVRLLLQRQPVTGETLDIQFIDDDVAPGRILARQSFTVR